MNLELDQAPSCWGYGHAWPCMAFYVGAGDVNSILHPLSHLPVSPFLLCHSVKCLGLDLYITTFFHKNNIYFKTLSQRKPLNTQRYWPGWRLLPRFILQICTVAFCGSPGVRKAGLQSYSPVMPRFGGHPHRTLTGLVTYSTGTRLSPLLTRPPPGC